MIVLGVETSCDDTSIAVVSDNKLLNCTTASQFAAHCTYGGVVPEIASREHLQQISDVYCSALEKSGVNPSDIDCFSATCGPGLMGSLLVGVQFTRGLSLRYCRPFIPVNHLEGHIFSAFINNTPPPLPWLILLVSGGHTMLIRCDSFFSYQVLGNTIDDSVGECFDKVARFLGMGYPGGPLIEKSAYSGSDCVRFPDVLLSGSEIRFSYSGLKTAVLNYSRKNSAPLENICFSFQRAAIMPLVKAVRESLKIFSPAALILAGGVSANSLLRELCAETAQEHGIRFCVPEKQWSMDNAAMIAAAAFFRQTKNCCGRDDFRIDPALKII